MNSQKLILISFLLSSLSIGSFIGYSIYRKKEPINSRELVNQEKEKEELIIKLNNELDLAETNRLFAFLFFIHFFNWLTLLRKLGIDEISKRNDYIDNLEWQHPNKKVLVE